ncbi:MAG TPA: GNAT family N-acetyltransferase [Burkholderiales bacterium]|nr:GNAT family N-acetyltransferase [Burkholderiales bacterium]
MQIEVFNPAYAQGVVDTILPIQREEFGIRISIDDQPDLKDIPGFYQRGAGNFWVAVEDDAVIGTIALLDIGNRQAALRKMFVAKPFRGSARNVARQLLDTLMQWSRDRGIAQIYLGTTPAFQAAHRFYEKHGFVEIAKEVLPPAFPVMKVDTKFYLLALAP